MKVSVLIPVLNGEKYIAQAVLSAISQPETGEVIVVDDGSTDNSLTVCRQLQREYSNVSLYQHPGGIHRGVAACRNLLIEKSSCEYLAFLDADDYFMPNRLQTAVGILDSDPSIDVVYDAYETFYEDPNMQQQWITTTTSEYRLCVLSKTVQPDKLFHHVMLTGARHVIWQIVARRSVYNKVPPFCTEVSTTDDALILHQMLAICRFAPGEVNKPMIMHRAHTTNVYEGMPQKNPSRARDLERLWSQHYWHWCRQNLSVEDMEFVRHYQIFRASSMGPFVFLRRMRPMALFIKIHYVVSLICLPIYFPGINRSRHYWGSLLNAFLGKKIVHKIP